VSQYITEPASNHVIAKVNPVDWAEICGVFGILISLIGIWMHWRLQDWLAALEEALKDGKINHRQFSQSVRRAHWVPMLFTLTGVGLLVGVAYRYLS
jgi:hypothetical protein